MNVPYKLPILKWPRDVKGKNAHMKPTFINTRKGPSKFSMYDAKGSMVKAFSETSLEGTTGAWSWYYMLRP